MNFTGYFVAEDNKGSPIIPFRGKRLGFVQVSIIQEGYKKLGSSGSLSKNFHGVGIGPLSKILAVK